MKSFFRRHASEIYPPPNIPPPNKPIHSAITLHTSDTHYDRLQKLATLLIQKPIFDEVINVETKALLTAFGFLLCSYTRMNALALCLLNYTQLFGLFNLIRAETIKKLRNSHSDITESQANILMQTFQDVLRLHKRFKPLYWRKFRTQKLLPTGSTSHLISPDHRMFHCCKCICTIKHEVPACITHHKNCRWHQYHILQTHCAPCKELWKRYSTNTLK